MAQSASCTSSPPTTPRMLALGAARIASGCQRISRRFFFLRRNSSASGSKSGRDQHLGEDLVDHLRQLQVQVWLAMRMPPNGDSGSVAKARR